MHKHRNALASLRVSKELCHPLCTFHQTAGVKDWHRILPPSVISSAADVRPEEVLDGLRGSVLLDGALAPDAVTRAHAATDALLGAFAAAMRSLQPSTATPVEAAEEQAQVAKTFAIIKVNILVNYLK